MVGQGIYWLGLPVAQGFLVGCGETVSDSNCQHCYTENDSNYAVNRKSAMAGSSRIRAIVATAENFLLALMNLSILSHFARVLLGFPCDSIITIASSKNQTLRENSSLLLQPGVLSCDSCVVAFIGFPHENNVSG